MTTSSHRVVTIITEAALENTLTRELDALGVSGYTIVDVRGKGHHGERKAGWDASANIRIEVVCSEAIANNITQDFRKKYYADYAMVIFSSAVEVLRKDRF